MNAYIRRSLNAIRRSLQFVADNPVDNELALVFSAQLQSQLTRLERIAALQRLGRAAMLGAAQNRQQLADALREEMRNLARIARVLDKRQYPDIAAQMRTANLKVYIELLSRARNFITVTRPLQAVFIAYGAPADFIVRLETLIAAVDEARDHKFTGQGEWIASTADLTFETRAAIRTLRSLQVIVANCYRGNHDLTAAWQAATHIERAPKRTTTSAHTPSVHQAALATPHPTSAGDVANDVSLSQATAAQFAPEPPI